MDQVKIGKYIAQKRHAKGLTQNALADKLLVSDKAVSKWERGICLPNIELLIPLSDILDIKVEELLSDDDTAGSLDANNVVVGAVKIYTKELRKRELKKRIAIIIVILTLVLALIVLPLYSKYSSSKQDEKAYDAWIQASTSIISILDSSNNIREDGYFIDTDAYYKFKTALYESIDKMALFSECTEAGERANSLASEVDVILSHEMRQLELNAFIYLENGGDNYLCSQEEKKSIDEVLEKLPKMHDEICKEMGVITPGITHLYGKSF